MKALYSNLCGMILFFVKKYICIFNLKDMYQDINISFGDGIISVNFLYYLSVFSILSHNEYYCFFSKKCSLMTGII